ncbi:DNA cytosine methyltransferase [Streptomyces sp. NPDC059015]|uniref:DNA cytosine methyltransferase n=1 Tax=unclassified Streptomyces TaxID=2593676 RepID=UPI00368032B5
MIVDLFAGPGGMDHGAHMAGVPSVGIEWDVNAVATRIAAGLATVHGDVRTYGPRDFPDATILTGGPPCQTFTIAGDGSGRAELDRIITAVKQMGAGDHVDPSMFADERTALILEPLRWAIEDFECGYNAIVLEQVPQALPVWEAYAEVLRAEGYSVATGILRAEQYGVPQTRRRAVLVARLVGDAVLPAPTHRPYRKGVPQHEGDPRLLPWLSMADTLPNRGPFTVISNYGTGGDPKNRGRRTSAEPAFTVTGKISRLRLVDPDGRELPRLTPSEAGRLQGFPADWPWSGCEIPQQIGNACPPPLATALIRAALASAV